MSEAKQESGIGRKPRVSVILPVYNGSRFLAGTLESVLAQSFRDFELIVVDDGSTDGSPAILDSYAVADPRIRVIRQANAGRSAAGNRAVQASQGEYIAPMDQDDLCFRNRLALQVEFLDRHRHIGMVGGQALLIDAAGRCLDLIEVPVGEDKCRETFARSNCFIHPASMFRRTVFDAAGGYRETYTLAHDHDLWLRMSQHATLSNLPNLLLSWRLHGGNLSAIRARRQLMESLSARISHRRRLRGSGDLFFDAKSTVKDIAERTGEDAGTIAEYAVGWYAWFLGDITRTASAWQTWRALREALEVLGDRADDGTESRLEEVCIGAMRRDGRRSGPILFLALQWIAGEDFLRNRRRRYQQLLQVVRSGGPALRISFDASAPAGRLREGGWLSPIEVWRGDGVSYMRLRGHAPWELRRGGVALCIHGIRSAEVAIASLIAVGDDGANAPEDQRPGPRFEIGLLIRESDSFHPGALAITTRDRSGEWIRLMHPDAGSGGRSGGSPAAAS